MHGGKGIGWSGACVNITVFKVTFILGIKGIILDYVYISCTLRLQLFVSIKVLVCQQWDEIYLADFSSIDALVLLWDG